MKKPVVYFMFNRPDHVSKSFQPIRNYKPEELLIVCDGPREGYLSDHENIKKCIEMVKPVDWDCKVHLDYSSVNLGCGKRVSSGLDLAFTLYEDAIVIEDDCIVSSEFFEFCSLGLEKYSNDNTVGAISGTSFIDFFDGSSYFSPFVNVWGWATWRRVWSDYSYKMSFWRDIDDIAHNKEMWNHYGMRRTFERMFNLVKTGEIDTWDYQFSETLFRTNRKVLISGRNLVSNIGFGPEATHTKSENSQFSKMEIEKIVRFNPNHFNNIYSLTLEQTISNFNFCYTSGKDIGKSWLIFFIKRFLRFLIKLKK